MNEDKKTVRIYTGPTMIANGLVARLNHLGISPIVKDDHQSGITGGFSTGVPNQVRLFIRNEQLDTAKSMINEYFTQNRILKKVYKRADFLNGKFQTCFSNLF